jgi:voltage-gated potassium channel
MKIGAAVTAAVVAPLRGRSLRAAISLLVLIVGAVAVFSVGFHAIMAVEGRDYSWPTSIYWTIVTMSTLGFGDIVFESDLGRIYSVVVLLTGAVLILILLPFTFIQLIYVPWREALREARAPRSLPASTRGHLLVTGRDPVEEALAQRARASGLRCVLLVEDTEEALTLSEQGYDVMVGSLDEPETYRAARFDQAAMLFTAQTDERNSNIAFTAREVSSEGLVVTTARSPDAVDVLQLAGADHVVELGRSLGEAFARRILTPDARCSEISRFDDLVIAETSAAGTDLVGLTLADLELRHRFGVSVVGVWDRGTLQPAAPDVRIEESSILLLAGEEQGLADYDAAYSEDPAGETDPIEGPVVILGGGRVGRATASNLQDQGIACRVVERLEERVRHIEGAVIGDAADIAVLRRAGIEEASAVVVTTHDDDTNVFLTLYCRRLRGDVEILGRARLDRNVSTIHRAGADFVLSYASTGATEAWNLLREDSTLLLAEGLIVFRVPMPSILAGRRLANTSIPSETGCTVVAVVHNGHATTAVNGDTLLPPSADLVLIGDADAETCFLQRYVASDAGRSWWSPLAAIFRR